MSFLLDTNVVSELGKRERANSGVRAWVESIDADRLWLSVVVVGELRQGVERVRLRDARSAAHLDRWLNGLLRDYADRIIPVDPVVMDLWGRLNVPDPLPAIDGLLAATALVHGSTLVTRNVRHVKKTGVPLMNPFSR